MIGIKIIIGIVIICISGYIGIEMAENLRAREDVLRDFSKFLNMLKSEMMYLNSNIPSCFESARQTLKSNLKYAIENIVIDMAKFGVSKVDISIEENIKNLECLSKEDELFIISTLKNLGLSDINSQINIIDNAISIVEEKIKEANDKKNKDSKVYKTVGIIAGIIVVVILI
jgi:stage III sporulation protein AB